MFPAASTAIWLPPNPRTATLATVPGGLSSTMNPVFELASPLTAPGVVGNPTPVVKPVRYASPELSTAIPSTCADANPPMYVAYTTTPLGSSLAATPDHC